MRADRPRAKRLDFFFVFFKPDASDEFLATIKAIYLLKMIFSRT